MRKYKGGEGTGGWEGHYTSSVTLAKSLVIVGRCFKKLSWSRNIHYTVGVILGVSITSEMFQIRDRHFVRQTFLKELYN